MTTADIARPALPWLRVLRTAAVGAALGVIAVAGAIWLAYYRLHADGVAHQSVSLIGVHIYELVRQGGNVTGTADETHIPFLAFGFALAAVAIHLMVWALRPRPAAG